MLNKNVEKIFNDEALKLINSKNEDYASPQDNYANFRMVEFSGLPTWVGVHVRLQDKISRLNGFVRRFIETGNISSAVDESMEDTLLDTINYSAIMLDTYRQYKELQNHGTNTRATRQDTNRNEAGTHIVHSRQDIDAVGDPRDPTRTANQENEEGC